MKTSNFLNKLIVFGLVAFSMSCSKDDGCEQQTFYLDNDKDGFGQTDKTKLACEKPDGYADKSGDTDDGNGKIYPGCTQITYYEDKDKDEYGNPDVTKQSCDDETAPDGFTANSGDTNDQDANINPGCTNKYYKDLDGDTYGDPETEILACDQPGGYVTNNKDCNDEDPNANPDVTATYYKDWDGDLYGDPNESQVFSVCPGPEGYVLDDTDCDDQNPSINPGAEEIGGDGLDSNCDGFNAIVWDGPDMVFSKAANDDWTVKENRDRLTDNVSFTRQDTGPMYNYQWWQDEFKADAIHVDSSDSDLHADFWDKETATDKDFKFSGGTKGVRWSILVDRDNPSGNIGWETYPFYAQLGKPEGFYSFHNIVSIITALQDGFEIDGVANDFNILLKGQPGTDDVDFEDIVGVKLGVWLVEEDIYLSLKFAEWGLKQSGGGAFSYTRSTPNN